MQAAVRAPLFDWEQDRRYFFNEVQRGYYFSNQKVVRVQHPLELFAGETSYYNIMWSSTTLYEILSKICNISFFFLLICHSIKTRSFLMVIFLLILAWNIDPTLECRHRVNIAPIMVRNILPFHKQYFCNNGTSLEIFPM